MKHLLLAACAAFVIGVTLQAPSATAGGLTACVHAKTQIGDGSTSNANQNCSYNMNGTMQAGNSTSTTVRQKGVHNDSTSIQIGDNGSAKVMQRGGDNGAGVLQSGNHNRARVKQGI